MIAFCGSRGGAPSKSLMGRSGRALLGGARARLLKALAGCLPGSCPPLFSTSVQAAILASLSPALLLQIGHSRLTCGGGGCCAIAVAAVNRLRQETLRQETSAIFFAHVHISILRRNGSIASRVVLDPAISLHAPRPGSIHSLLQPSRTCH